MGTKLIEDLKRIEQLAFKRPKACRGLIEEFHSLPKSAKKHPNYKLLERVYPWLFVPFSLWPIDVGGLTKILLTAVSDGKRLTGEVSVLIDLLGAVPPQIAQAVVAAHEHQVRTGNYEDLICAQHKFDLKEQTLAQKEEFKADWETLKKCFDVDKYRDGKGIIRRQMAQERNFRSEGWDFCWKTQKDRFKVVFDSFCHKWVLYGMEKELPLLQKLSVNVTPLGTMIFIPRYWSFDHKRDLKWTAINRLHRSRDVHRQGVKLTSGQLTRLNEAGQAARLWKMAEKAGLKGDARSSWVMGNLKWRPQTDARQLRRLLELR